MRKVAVVVFSLGLFGRSIFPVSADQTAGSSSLANSGAVQSHAELTYDTEISLLSGRADAVSLAEILSKLAQVPGLQLEQRYVPMVEEKVSFHFENKPVRDAIEELLRDYDYFTSGPDNVSHTLKLVLLGPAAAPIDEEQPFAPIISTPPPVQNSGAQREEGETLPLRGLDDFWPLKRVQAGELTLNKFKHEDEEANSQSSAEEFAAIQQQALLAEAEERLARARAVLSSDYSYLYQDALSDVVGIDDPQVTESLLSAANGEFGSVDELKEMSAETLWRHAADLEFNDEATNRALIELAASADTNTRVRQIAKQALQDMNEYLDRQQEDAAKALQD
jgi:hypothetical protein